MCRGVRPGQGRGLWWGVEKRSILVLLLCLLLFLLHAAAYWNYTIDDAFISFRYALNWVQGHGLVYNPGERTEGYTSPLWVILIAGFMRLGVSPIVGCKTLGLLTSLATMVLLAYLSRMACTRLWPAVVATGLLASSKVFVVNAIDGLETPLFTLFSLWALYCFLCEMKDPSRPPWSMVLAMGAYLTRPDGIIFAMGLLVIGGYLACFNSEFSRRWRRWMLVAGLIFVTVTVGHIGWRLAYYGVPLPNTFYAKRGGTYEMAYRGAANIFGFTKTIGGPVVWLLVLFVIAQRPWRTVGAISVLLIGSRVGFTIWSGGEWMGHCRFLAPALPAIYLLVGGACVEILDKTAQFSRARRAFLVAGLALATGVLVVSNLASSLLSMRPEVLAYARGLETAHIKLGKELRATASVTDSLACGDAGALPYYSGLTTIDTLGLNDAHIARLPGVFNDKYDVEYVLRREPTYIVLLSGSSHNVGFIGKTKANRATFLHPQFRAHYRYLREYTFRKGYSDGYYLFLYVRDSRNSSRLSGFDTTSGDWW